MTNEYQETKGGKFKKGNPGRPKGAKNKTRSDNRDLILSEAGEDKIRRLFEVIFQSAIGGNTQDAQFLVNWLAGKPPTDTNVSISAQNPMMGMLQQMAGYGESEEE